MCDVAGDLLGVVSPVGSDPLRDLVAVALEVAHGAAVDLLECFAHCFWVNIVLGGGV